MSTLNDAFKGFDINDMDLSSAGNWPIGIKFVCYLLVIALIVAGGWHFYITDKQSGLKREIAKEANLKNVFKEKAFQVASLPALRQQMKDVETKFAELKKQLPTEKEVPGLLDDITNLGSDSGLDIGSIKLASELQKDFYIELPININVAGSYHQLGQFVSGVAGLSRIVTLHDYSIQPGAGGVSMRISAKTYRFDNTK
jgi:type IV pilus assembly protein PilO